MALSNLINHAVSQLPCPNLRKNYFRWNTFKTWPLDVTLEFIVFQVEKIMMYHKGFLNNLISKAKFQHKYLDYLVLLFFQQHVTTIIALNA